MGKVKLSPVASESIEAIKVITDQTAIATGLMRAMKALLSGEISAQDSKAISRVASKRRREITRGVPKTKTEKQIEISDAINRRLQTKINMMKTMIKAKKHGD